MVNRLAVVVMAGLSCLSAQAAFPLAKDGQPAARIVIAADAHPAVAYAAEELQRWVEAISGARLPIDAGAGGAGPKVVLAVNPAGFEDDLAKMAGADGYAVRTSGDTVTLLAAKPKGVLNGVFKLLYRNSDIIWARPNTEFGTVYSSNPNLVLTQADYLDLPVYVLRGWQMGSGNHIPSEEWQVRNSSNWSAGSMRFREERVKYAPILEYGGGHNLVGIYIPERKYFDTHPEYYPLREGKRLRPSETSGSTQLCFTHPELLKVFIDEVDTRIKENPNYDTYRIMIEDNYNLCECPNCLQPLTLADGAEVKADDPAFRSTQFFLWLNQIAAHVKKHYPGKLILTFGYFFTEIPPRCPIESNISISYCPIYKNSKYTTTHPENKATYNRFTGWMQVTNQLTWREYYGLCGAFPRPMDAVALADWRYANSFGVNRTYSELYPDQDTERADHSRSWDVNAMYFWIMANGSWNPYQDVQAMRNDYLTRVFGEGGKDVGEFYRIIEDSWLEVGGMSSYNDRPRGNWLICVIKAKKTDACRAALERAAAKPMHSNGSKMLAALRGVFEDMTANLEVVRYRVPRVQTAPAFDPDFASGDWLRASAEDRFHRTNGSDATQRTAVRILHDGAAFYVGAKCFDSEPDKAYAKPAGQPRDRWPVGDKFEFFLTGLQDGKKVSYQIAFDINGNLYDACNKNASWDGDFTVQRQTTADGWSSLTVVPFTTLGYAQGEMPKDVSFAALRYYSHNNKSTEVTYLLDCAPNNQTSYTELILE